MMRNFNKPKYCLLLVLICLHTSDAFSQRWDSVGNRMSTYYNMGPDVLYADSNYLYMAGRFHTIGSMHIQGIGRWNGVKWDSMGAGIDRLIMYDTSNYNPGHTFAITPYHNKLYVGGSFSSVGYVKSTSLGTWDGTKWDSLPKQPFPYNYLGSDAIGALTVINNKLYIGGDFDTIAGKEIIGIACWNDTNWSSLNFPNLSLWGEINSICEYKGSIYVGGLFGGANGTISNIARFDSTGWHSVDTGIKGNPSSVWSMVIYNGELYVGGQFLKSDGNADNNIERWNGKSWRTVGGGTDSRIENLLVYNGKLYAMGTFSFAGGVYANKIAEWDGTKWCSLGSTFNNTLNASCTYKDSLYVAGAFSKIDLQNITYIAEWIGGNHTDSCENTTGISELKVENGKLNVYPNPSNGIFTLSLSDVNSACNLEVYNILGEKVYKTSINSGETQINFTNESEGVYLYRILSNTGNLVGQGKIVLQK